MECRDHQNADQCRIKRHRAGMFRLLVLFCAKAAGNIGGSSASKDVADGLNDEKHWKSQRNSGQLKRIIQHSKKIILSLVQYKKIVYTTV